MTTIAVALSLLLLPALAGYALETFATRRGAAAYGALVGLAVAFIFFASGHVVMTDSLSEMMPAWIPLRMEIVLATGALELLIAVGLLVPQTRRLAGWTAMAVLILFFPANIYAAMNGIGPGGHQAGPSYLLVRAPLQIVLVLWTWLFVLRKKRPRTTRQTAANATPELRVPPHQ